VTLAKQEEGRADEHAHFASDLHFIDNIVDQPKLVVAV
jgi:hypothetical protein